MQQSFGTKELLAYWNLMTHGLSRIPVHIIKRDPRAMGEGS
jgi:hypothetical protein